MKVTNLILRQYQVVLLNGFILDPFKISFEELIEDNNVEWNYSLHEDFDKVLNLQVGDSIYFQPNRDNDKTKGIILRIK